MYRSKGMERSEAGLSKINLMALILTALLFSAVLLPAIGLDTEKSNLASCQRNLRLIWNGLELYCSDYDGIFPPAIVGRTEGYAQKNMMYFLCPRYVKNPRTFHCSGDFTTWTDDGARMGIPPRGTSHRYYRVSSNYSVPTIQRLSR